MKLYEVVALPKIWTKNLKKFCPEYWRQNILNSFVHILVNVTTSYLIMFIMKFPNLYMHALYVSVFHTSRLLYLKNSLSVRFSGQSSTVSPFTQHLFFLHFRELIRFYSSFLGRRHSENVSKKIQIKPEKNFNFLIFIKKNN